MEENKTAARVLWIAIFAVTTYAGYKSDNVGVQILTGFSSSFAFNEFTKTLG